MLERCVLPRNVFIKKKIVPKCFWWLQMSTYYAEKIVTYLYYTKQ